LPEHATGQHPLCILLTPPLTSTRRPLQGAAQAWEGQGQWGSEEAAAVGGGALGRWLMTSTRRKRVAKMNKHKWKKRRKRERMRSDKRKTS
jgi:Mitochondrial domain of unknown function (DUF1713)